MLSNQEGVNECSSISFPIVKFFLKYMLTCFSCFSLYASTVLRRRGTIPVNGIEEVRNGRKVISE